MVHLVYYDNSVACRLEIVENGAMCRIVGCWEYSQPQYLSPDTLSAMTNCLAHGGPDDSGIFIDHELGLGLGHRRLSILDLSALGHQPATSTNGRYTVVYNGEIYNFREIAQKLQQRGVFCSNTSDTQVLLAAISEWGIESAVQTFRGMFAFAVWDRDTQKLTLVRDRLGVKPLYWSCSDGRVLFASELKAFHHHPKFNKTLSSTAVRDFFKFGYIGHDRSVFSSVHKVLPGEIVNISSNGKVDKSLYWDIREFYRRPKITGSISDLIDEAETRIREAFRYRMVSDVPIGIFLSGGIDSSLVTAILAQESSIPLRTFSIGFKEQAFDESKYAAQIAKHIGTHHETQFCTMADMVALMPHLTEIYDEPMGDTSALPTYMVCKMASSYVKVVLSADGADEQFAGYQTYRHLDRIYQTSRLAPSFIGSILQKASQLPGIPLSTKMRLAKLAPLLRDGLSKGALHQRLSAVFQESELNQLIPSSSSIFIKSEFDTQVDIGLINDLTHYLPDDILVKVDRASMATSIEAREPFLDHCLVEWTSQLSYDFKIQNRYRKELLRRILSKHIPRPLFERQKQGFSIPLKQWLRYDLKDYRRSILSRPILDNIGLLDTTKCLELQQQFEKDDPSVTANQIWLIMVFSAWWHRWVAK